MKKQLLFAFGAAALLASCSNDIDSPVANGNDGYLRVNGTIDELKTRISDSGTDFTSDDKIGVYAVNGTDSNVEYTYANDAFSSNSPIKVNETGDSFTAYYPYNQDGGVLTFNVATTPVDYLFATSENVTSANPSVTFQFKHVMSKLAFTVENTGDAELKDATIEVSVADVVTDGSFDTKSGELTAGSTTSTLTGSVTNNNVSFIVPSFTNANDKELAVTVKVTNGTAVSTFKGSITPALKAATQYNYTLKYEINEDEQPSQQVENLEVKGSAGGWQQESNKDVTTNEVLDPVDVGYFLLKNGKWISPEASNLDDVKDKIVAVVYYVATSDELTTQGFPKANGLAIAIKNADQGQWGAGNNCKLSEWYTSTCKDEAKAYEGLYEISGTTLPTKTKLAGYVNTKVMQLAYETDGGEGTTIKISNIIGLLETANKNKVNDVEWYLPSYGEFRVMIDNFVAINNSLNKLDEKDLLVALSGDNPVADTNGFYWSSSLRAANAWASSMKELDSATEIANNCTLSRNGTTNDGYFRFAIAF